MMTRPDFEKKQVLFVFTLEGDKISFRNDNIVVTDSEGKIKHQSTCYRIFALFIIGHITLTSGLIERSHKFCFPIYLMTPSFRTVDFIGHRTEGNTALRRIQYSRSGLNLAKYIVCNKILNQRNTLTLQRTNDWHLCDTISKLDTIISEVRSYDGDVRGLMGLEGNAAKLYFENHFNTCEWTGRRPRVKDNIINATLDIGYSLLFNYIDAMLSMYGFDTYCGFLHTEFYLRKSLTCDMVEPFRPIIDWQVRKAMNRGQIKEEHFNISDRRYLLDIRYRKDYIGFLMKPILEKREEIFLYFQSFYRSFMKGSETDKFPLFIIGDTHAADKL